MPDPLTLKVKPNADFHLLGTLIRLDKRRTYLAIPASNQPEWERRGLVFLQVDYKGNPSTCPLEEHAYGFLLGREDYTTVMDDD